MHESYKKWLEDGKPKVICSCGCNGKQWKLIPVCLSCHAKIHNNKKIKE